MPKSDKPWITFRPTQEEAELLEQYCYLKRLTKTDVLRSFIRQLRAEEGENSHHIIKVELGKTESQVLESYCSEHKMTPTSVVRQLIRSLAGEDMERVTATFFTPSLLPTTGAIDALGYDKEGNVLATFTVPPELAKELSEKMTNVSVGYTVKPDNWGDKKWEGNDRPKAIHNDPETQKWLESLSAQADQELADARSLRSMATQMLAIAERLEG